MIGGIDSVDDEEDYDLVDKGTLEDYKYFHSNMNPCNINLTKIYHNMDTSYPDMTLHCMEDGTKLKCHRVILSACSQYFTNAFGWNPSNELEIHNGISGETMRSILRYIYCDTPYASILNLDNVFEVLVAADYFVMLPLVNSCIGFLSSKTNTSTCIGFLQRSWQQKIPTMTTLMLRYVATNFSEILFDECSNKELSQLPLPLMINVLKSDHLIIRDPKTNLLTSPSQREKLVLDFILNYVHFASEITDITCLLSCVRWHLLNILCPENDAQLSMFPDFNHVKHTKWFRSPPGTLLPTMEDKSLYSTRAYTCSELAATRPILMDLRPPTDPRTKFCIVAQGNEYISGLSVITKLPHLRVAGLAINISSMSHDAIKAHSVGLRPGPLSSVGIVDLKPSEHITAVSATQSFDFRQIIESLTFKTSQNNEFGPYGRQSGETVWTPIMDTVKTKREELVYMNRESVYQGTIRIPPPLYTHLVGVTGTSAQSEDDGAEVITDLSFLFRLMIPSSELAINNQLTHEFISPQSTSRANMVEDFDCDELDHERMVEEMYEYEDIPEHLQ